MNEVSNNTFPVALRALQDADRLKSQVYEKQLWKADDRDADHEIVTFMVAFIQRFRDLKIPMFAHCLVRDYDEQLNLFATGFSKDSPVDGMWPHKKWAVDLIHSEYLWNLHQVQWTAIGEIGKEVAAKAGIKVKWGGDFKGFFDPAHWELLDWKERCKAELPTPYRNTFGSPDAMRG